MSRYIKWTDPDGTHNVFDTVPLDFGAPERIPPHAFEPEARHFLNGSEGITVTGPCWCGGDETHPIHSPVLP